MRQTKWRLMAVVLAALVALSAFAPVLARQNQSPIHGLNPADLDLSADPRVDFNRFANGGWLDRTTIPSDQPSYGVFQELNDRTEQQLLDLLATLAAGANTAPSTDEAKAVQLYEQGIDLAARNAQGIQPIQPTIAAIDQIGDLAALHRFLQGSIFMGPPGLLPVGGAPDLMNSSVNVAYLGGPTLGLPNRDYYLQDDAANEQVRAAYLATSAKLLGFIGYDATRAQAAAQSVYDLERKLAEQTLTREEQQNFSLYYNPLPVAELPTTYPLMDWNQYLQTLGLTGVPQLIVTELKYLQALPAIVQQTPLDALKDYLKLQTLWGASGFLSEEIEATAFEFQGKVLSGVQEQEPIEERLLGAVNGLVGEAVGKLYVAQYFPPEAKAQITDLVEELRIAFRQRLEQNVWMSPPTKAVALDKLAKLGVKVGYPDKWRTYEAVEIQDSYAGSVVSASNAELRRNLSQVGKPVDKEDWGLPPQVVNAFYNPQNNEIVFPAGILQPPFFDYQADPASNFGAIGYVIGHEITHGFDLQGSQFDADGNLATWWTPEDQTRFDELNKQVAAQYAAIEVLPGLFINGQITVTENVADLGGVQVAFDALRNKLQSEGQSLQGTPAASPMASPAATPMASPIASPDAQAIATFTQEQRFYIAVATVWRTKYRDEYLTTLVKTDSHSPGQVRATQPSKNTDGFYDAFAIQAGDPMYLEPDQRIVVW